MFLNKFIHYWCQTTLNAMPMAEHLLYLENHALDAWFSKAYSGEDDKALQIG